MHSRYFLRKLEWRYRARYILNFLKHRTVCVKSENSIGFVVSEARTLRMNCEGKVAVITGGTKGIGLCIVKKLLGTDIKVIAIFQRESSSSKKVFDDMNKQYGERIDFYPCDVTNTSQLEGCFDKVLEKFKTIDILINNAGILTENVPERMIDINYKAVVLGSLMMIERVGKHKGGNGGTIINNASILGLQNHILPIYCSTKHAVVSFTRTMADQFAKTGVRVMAICPGVTDTSMLADISNNIDFIDSDGAIALLPPMQSPENVSSALLTIIGQGNSGEVWVSEEDQLPYIVKGVEDYKSLRIN